MSLFKLDDTVVWNGERLTIEDKYRNNEGDWIYILSDGTYVNEWELLKGGCTGHK